MTHDELLAKIDSLNDSCSVANRLATSLRAVVELHKPTSDDVFNRCSHCITAEAYDAWYSDYPCPTIQAIEKELR